MYNENDARYAAKVLNVQFDKFSLEEFLDGINIELEHGTVDPLTNVTDDDLIMTAKIALAHLNEFENYYFISTSLYDCNTISWRISCI